MTKTARLGLPMLAAEQALKHITHNEALLLLDALVHLEFRGVGVQTPPPAPEMGASYALGTEPVGGWEGESGRVATWTQGGWRFLTPESGWLAWDAVRGQILVYREHGWMPALARAEAVGFGTDADPTNRLAVRSEAALFAAVPAAEGGNGDVRLTLNKEIESDVATVLFQSGWSGRAEIGIAGSDDFVFKVSADGIAFETAMTFAADTAFVTINTIAGNTVSFPTVAGGILTVATGHVVPAPEAGMADVIDTIEGGFDGAFLVVSGAAGMALTLKHGTGNLRLGSDRVLSGASDTVLLVRREANWLALGFADND